MLETICDDAQCQRLHMSDGLVAVFAIAHDAVERRYFRNPTAIVFDFEFYRESHPMTVASGQAV